MADASLTRSARLVVCDAEGAALGSTPYFTVPSPHWGFVEPLEATAKADLGLSITVLRLLSVYRGSHRAPDRVSYLVQAEGPIAGLAPATHDDRRALQPHPLRMRWAEPGGPAALIAWAERALEASGIRLTAPPVHVRTWNLSSIWRLPTTAGTIWLKAVPPFFAHESAIIERFAGHAVPHLLAGDIGVCLLADVAGEDLYVPSDDAARTMVDALVTIQRGPGADVDALLALGLPDWRLSSLTVSSAGAIAACAGELERDELDALEDLVAGFDARQRDLDACGIPDSLVHGDFHPGNVRGSGLDLTILDWGDSGIGHPLLDAAAFTQWMSETQGVAMLAHWAQRWRSEVPGSDPARAAALIAPVAALRQAVVYRHFLDHIEPDERIYHETDDLLWLHRTAQLLTAT